MKDLDKVYRDAPKFESPAALDQRILRVAETRSRSRQDQTETVRLNSAARLNSRWRIAGLAVTATGMFAIGLGVLLQTGMINYGDKVDPVADSSIVVSAETARTGVSNRRADGVSVGAPQLSSSSKVVPRTSESVEESLLVNESQIAKLDQLTVAEQPMSLATDDIPAVTDTSQSVGALDNSMAESASVATSQLAPPQEAEIAIADSDAGDLATSIASSARVDSAQVEADNTQAADNMIAAAPELAESETRENSRSSSTIASLAVQKSTQITSAESQVSAGTTSDFSAKSGNKRLTQIRSVDWLLKQNQNDFTVQLAPIANKTTLFLIADNLPLVTDQLRAGSVSWLLLHGRFTDRATAELAMAEIINSVAELPQVKALVDPKIVSFGEIRQSLK